MDRYKLSTSTTIGDKTLTFNADYRNILFIFKIFNDPDLLDVERISLALENFYDTDEYLTCVDAAISEMMFFISYGEPEQNKSSANKKPLYDWEQDFDIIVAPINTIIGSDVRGVDFLHWWTFLSAFMEIGECTFNTYVGIRDKINRGKRLEKWEEKVYQDNRDKIRLNKKVDATTQALMDEILGKGV